MTKITAPNANTTQSARAPAVVLPPDTGAAKELAKLNRENARPGSISGKEMADAITNATRDPDGQAAGREYDTIKSWVKTHGAQLSPEAKKVFGVYEKECLKARAAGQTGIDFRVYNQMTRQLQAAARPDYKDVSTAEELNKLAAGNTKPGSISGKEMAEAIINGSKDLDGHASTSEFKDIQKFVRENAQLLSPEAKKVFDVYSKQVKDAGKDGITSDEFARMTRDMLRVAGPGYKDQSTAGALKDLAAANGKPGSISGKEMMESIVKGTADLDGQAAKTEFADVAKFVRENEQLLSPEARQVFDVYKKTVDGAKGGTISLRDYMKMQGEMAKVAGPRYADKSAADALNGLASTNKEPGSIGGKEFTQAVLGGIKDLDGHAAGKEFDAVAKFVKENEQLLSPEAKKAFAVYSQYAHAARAHGQTGIPLRDFTRMSLDMQRVSTPLYGDKSAGEVLNGLAKDNTTRGSISAAELRDAIINGTRDLDGQAAGKEFADVAKFVKENGELLSPEAKKIFAVYEQYAKAAQGKHQTGIPLNEFGAMHLKMNGIVNEGLPLTATAPQAAQDLAQVGQNPSAGSATGSQVVSGVQNGLQDIANAFGNPSALFPGMAGFGEAVGQLAQLAGALLGLEPLFGKGGRDALSGLNQALQDIGDIGKTPEGPLNLGEVLGQLQKVLEDLAKLLGIPTPPASGNTGAVPSPSTGNTGVVPPPPGPVTGAPPPVVPSPVGPLPVPFPRPDASASAAISDLLKNNPRPGSISGAEMTEAIIKGTSDRDNKSAGAEFAAFAKFAREHGNLLSPEARKVFGVYEQHARAAQARGQTGIELGEYLHMQREMRAVAPPQYKDVSAAKQLEALAAGNKQAGSISGKEMMDAIIQGTHDRDGQAAGKEFSDISKFVRENHQLLSPEAKKCFDLYKAHADAARARGQSGIDVRDFARLEKELAAASTPKYQDRTAAASLTELAKANPKAGSISGNEMSDAIIKATRDPDNQAAGKEYADLAKFVKENGQLLSPEAKRAFGVYEKYAKAAQAKGQTGIDGNAFLRMQGEMRQVGSPSYQDRTTAGELKALAAGNKQPGSISGAEMMAAIKRGTADFDNQAAGKEFADVAKFVRENEQLLSPEAKRAFAVYEKHAQAAQKQGQSGLTLPQSNAMFAEMSRVAQPVFKDPSAAGAVKDLLAHNKTPNSVNAREMSQAILRGTSDLDAQAAGKEFADFAKFAKENAQLLSPGAQKAFGIYEKYAKAAQAKGQTGIPVGEYQKMARELQLLSLFNR